MDVDNGPEGLVRRENDWLYSAAGLRASALRCARWRTNGLVFESGSRLQ